jgi:hypothetical protein
VNKIVVRFSTNQLLISRLVRWRTNSQWSHVDLVLSDIDTRVTALPFEGSIVRPIPLQCYPPVYFDVVRWVSDEVLSEIKFWAAVESGMRYDFLGAAALGIDRQWELTGCWYCSELVAEILMRVGVIPRVHLPQLTPQDLFNIITGYDNGFQNARIDISSQDSKS